MHDILRAAALAVAGAIVVACSDSPVAPSIAGSASVQTSAQPCGTTTTTNLVLNSGRALGTVEAWNDATDLHLVLATDEWTMKEISAWVGLDAADIPLALNGQPKLREFPLYTRQAPSVLRWEFTIPLASIPAAAGETVVLTARADVFSPGGRKGVAWTEGTPINPPYWAMYFTHTIQDCNGGPPPPPPGTDIVVYNDMNPFDNTSMANPNNQLMVANLVGYSHAGPRGSATEVWIDRGRGANCVGSGECTQAAHATFEAAIAGAGYTPVGVLSDAPDFYATIPPNVKVIFLFMPEVPYTINEINAFKQFAGEGGRIVFLGEWVGFYGTAGIALENQFLLDMGAVMTNLGDTIDCGYTTLPGTSLRPHQITTGMTNVTMACSSQMILGPNDYALYYDSSNSLVLSAVATISLTPLSASSRQTLPPSAAAVVEATAATGSGR
jgi:hypothetical protein